MWSIFIRFLWSWCDKWHFKKQFGMKWAAFLWFIQFIHKSLSVFQHTAVNSNVGLFCRWVWNPPAVSLVISSVGWSAELSADSNSRPPQPAPMNSRFSSHQFIPKLAGLPVPSAYVMHLILLFITAVNSEHHPCMFITTVFHWRIMTREMITLFFVFFGVLFRCF